MLQPLTYLRTKIKALRDSWFLKKHHCDSWEQYNRHYDSDINWRSSRVRDFYHGYPFFYCFENRQHDIYSWDLGYDGCYVVNLWCKEHCSDKYRTDMFRVIKCPATSNQWVMNDLGGSDYMFIAFKNEHDAFKFMLKWG